MPKDADRERKEVEAAVQELARGGGFVCPECGAASGDPVANARYGFVCRGCDFVINMVG